MTIFFLFVISALLEVVSLGAFYPFIGNLMSFDQSSISSGGKILNFINEIVRILPFRDPIVGSSIFLLTMLIISNLVTFLSESVAVWYRFKLHAKYMDKMFVSIMSRNYGNFVEDKHGDVIYLGLEASQSVGEMLLYAPKIGGEILKISAITVLLLTVSVALTGVVVVIMIVFGLTIHLFAELIIAPTAKSLQAVQIKRNQVFSETSLGIRQIKLFGILKHKIKQYTKQTERDFKLSVKNTVSANIPKHLVQILAGSTVVGVILFGRYSDNIDVTVLLPILSVYLVALMRVLPSLTVVGQLWLGLKGLGPRLVVTYNALNDPTSFSDRFGVRELSDIRDRITVKDVSYSYSDNRLVLDRVNMVIPRGKVTAIVGESGSGKSTLVNIMSGMYVPDSGNILVDGVDYREYSQSSWLSKIGVVTQDIFIFHESIDSNIRIGKPEAMANELEKASKISYAHQFILNTPDGYQTVVGDQGAKLSGGQKQRIAIARAMIRSPKFLIFDEATSSLDNVSEELIHQNLLRGDGDRATLIVAHRLSTVKKAHNIYVLSGGKLVEQGTHEELLKIGGYYHDLFYRQLRADSAPKYNS